MRVTPQIAPSSASCFGYLVRHIFLIQKIKIFNKKWNNEQRSGKTRMVSLTKIRDGLHSSMNKQDNEIQVHMKINIEGTREANITPYLPLIAMLKKLLSGLLLHADSDGPARNHLAQNRKNSKACATLCIIFVKTDVLPRVPFHFFRFFEYGPTMWSKISTDYYPYSVQPRSRKSRASSSKKKSHRQLHRRFL